MPAAILPGNMRLLALFILGLLSLQASAVTRNVTCSGTITTALQNAISASVNGDIVEISAGTCTTGTFGWSDKNITVQGAGKANTLITAESGIGQIISNGANAPQWKLKGFKLTGTGTVTPLTVWADSSATWRGPFLIYDVEFNYPNSGSSIYLFGPIHGVIANCIFRANYEAMILTGLRLTAGLESGGSVTSLVGSYGASLPIQPGNGDYLYIEDNEFHGDSGAKNCTGGTTWCGSSALDTDRTGTRVVFRRNNLFVSNIYAHWTSEGNWNSGYYEVYENTIDWTGGDTGGVPFVRLQGGGTGLFYNNTVKGFGTVHDVIRIGEDRLDRGGLPLNMCSSANSWDGNTDASAPGWPCLSQTGRDSNRTMAQIQAGTKQSTWPLYVWNNGPQDKCRNPAAAGAACDNSIDVDPLHPAYFKNTPHTTSGFGNGDIDWCKTAGQPTSCGNHTLTYTPYTYPHPLRQEPGGSPPVVTALTCSQTTVNSPLGATSCTATASNTPTSYTWSVSNCTTANCKQTGTTNPATYTCSCGGNCTICVVATNANGSSAQFCTAAGYLKSRYRTGSGLRAR